MKTYPVFLSVPVLFLIYKRLDTTKQVFSMIKKTQPLKLYIAGDGPKDWDKEEKDKVYVVRQFVLEHIDWDCEVKTLFRDKNLGCGRAVSEAITWFFEHEEMGIILEDDTVPSLSFFWFCEELLKKYKDDKRIGMISGNNFQDGIKRGDGDYYFSIYSHIWGWATWKDRWQGYDLELESFKDDKFIEELFTNPKAIKYWKDIFWKMKRREINTWDYPWTFHLWKKKQLSILPQVNLVSNIGFGRDATHTKVKQKGISEIPAEEIDILNLKHPSRIERDEEADEYTFKKCCAPRPLWFRIIRKIRTYIGAR